MEGHAEALIGLATQQDLALLVGQGLMLQGWAMATGGRTAEGLAQMQAERMGCRGERGGGYDAGVLRSRALAIALRHLVMIAFVAGGVGCAPIRNTPEQDLAWQRWWDCRAQAPDANLRIIDPDGRIRFEFVTGFERDRLLACLRSRDAAGPVLPEPIAEGQRRGP